MQKPQRSHLRRAVKAVVDSERCMGCGVCAQIDDRVHMTEVKGHQRPQFVGDTILPNAVEAQRAKLFRAVCPGISVRAGVTPEEGKRDRMLGPVIRAWNAWATDPEFRHRGSSGGVLSALSAWLVDTGEVRSVTAADNLANPRRTVPVTITSRDEALSSAGSRYTTCAIGSHPQANDSDRATVAKPCEVSALRRLNQVSETDSPLLMSFFCAGAPSAEATDELVAELGIDSTTPLRELWYRGHGWPGDFTAISEHGAQVATTYNESWGRALGPTVSWRCRLCVDGVGESADISAGDHWFTGEDGYPDFSEKDGRSVLMARTHRGLDVIQRAILAGVIEVEDVDLQHVKEMQPYQVQRRRYLMGRLLGTLALGQRVPVYRGFGLGRFTVRSPRRTYVEFRGTISRLLARKSTARPKRSST